MIRVLPRQRGQDQLRVLVKGHVGRREPHPVGESGDVQIKDCDPELVLSVDAAGLHADLLACAQQRRIFWEMLVEKAKLERLFFN